MFKKLLLKNQEEVNGLLAKLSVVYFLFFSAIYIFNYFDIFIVSKKSMSFLLIVEFVISILPVLVLYIFKQNKSWFKYFAISCFTISTSFLFVYLTFHIVLLLALPIVISSLFFDRKMVIFSYIEVSIAMIFCHILSKNFMILPEEPLKTMHEIMIFGFLPRFFIISFYAFVVFCLTNKTSKMFNSVAIYSTENNKLSEEMTNTQFELIQAVANLAEQEDQATGSHLKRVSEYMRVMSKGFNFDDDLCNKLSVASMLHDIGKLSIPKEIINKKGKLTDEEYKIMQRHTDIGYNLLKNSPGEIMAIAREITLDHHERWDGKGYFGKSGEQIDLYARIMSVIDVFDALVNVRPYKPKWTVIAAYNEIIENAGIQFDPKVVEVFKDCFKDLVSVFEKYEKNVEY